MPKNMGNPKLIDTIQMATMAFITMPWSLVCCFWQYFKGCVTASYLQWRVNAARLISVFNCKTFETVVVRQTNGKLLFFFFKAVNSYRSLQICTFQLLWFWGYCFNLSSWHGGSNFVQIYFSQSQRRSNGKRFAKMVIIRNLLFQRVLKVSVIYGVSLTWRNSFLKSKNFLDQLQGESIILHMYLNSVWLVTYKVT